MIIQFWWGSKKFNNRRVCWIYIEDISGITPQILQMEANRYCEEMGKGYTKKGFSSFIDYLNRIGIKCYKQNIYQIHVSSKGAKFEVSSDN